MKKVLQFLFIVFFLFSCGSKTTEETSDSLDVLMESDISENIINKKAESINSTEVIEKKILKNGRLGFNVKILKNEKRRIDTLVQKFGCYYDNEKLNNDYNETTFYLTIRIPVEKFEMFISSIEKGENEILYKEINAEDVTEQFIDLETRLTNKKKYMTRYQELLKNAKNVKEVLEIQERIRVLEEEIESTTGRLKYLGNLVNYSTLELEITQTKDFKYSPEKRFNITEKLKQSIYGGWFVFVDFLFILLYNWTFIILISIAIYIWFKNKKRRKNKKKVSDTNQTPNA